MLKDYQDIIESICARFGNIISPLDVATWLDNFDKVDWKKALIVLNSFEFFSFNDIIREFDFGLKRIVAESSSSKKIHLIPLGKVGKSGSAMAYYLKKTPTYSSNKKVTYIEYNDLSILTDQCTIVMVDDFAGTGNSIIKFYNQIKQNLPKDHTAYALTVVYMEKAKNNLEKNSIQVVGNERKPAFITRGSVFGYYPKMVTIRNFCYKYGNMIYPGHRYNENETNQHPLGYLNSQALIGFEHSIPNNTLPILWADCKINNRNGQWVPIFPRRGNWIIEKSKIFRQSQYYWVNLVFKLGLNETLFSTREKYNSDTIQLISMIYLKKKCKNMNSICQMLCISSVDYELIIEKGKKKKLFDLEGNLTKQAIHIFDEIQKKSKFQKDIIDKGLIIPEDVIYIPKRFQGNS